MKLKEYIENLQAIYDISGNLEVIYATDDEGNDFNNVSHKPPVVYFDKKHKDIVHPHDLEDALADGVKVKQVVCIN